MIPISLPTAAQSVAPATTTTTATTATIGLAGVSTETGEGAGLPGATLERGVPRQAEFAAHLLALETPAPSQTDASETALSAIIEPMTPAQPEPGMVLPRDGAILPGAALDLAEPMALPTDAAEEVIESPPWEVDDETEAPEGPPPRVPGARAETSGAQTEPEARDPAGDEPAGGREPVESVASPAFSNPQPTVATQDPPTAASAPVWTAQLTTQSRPTSVEEPSAHLRANTVRIANNRAAPTPVLPDRQAPVSDAPPISQTAALSPAVLESEAEPTNPQPQASASSTAASPSAAPGGQAALSASPQASLPATPLTAAPTPSSAPPPANAAPSLPSAGVDQMVEQIVENREAGRASRSEATLRHGEFGTVALRVEASAGAPISDWRATLSARDPGFVPAVQAALAERSVPAMSESATAQSGFSQRGQDQGSAQSGAWGGGAGAQEQRYGSSPGSGQGGAKPYSGEETDSGANTAAANTRDAAQSQRNETSGGALFA